MQRGNSRGDADGTLKGYGEIWYPPQAIANILSLSNLQKMFRVSYDSKDGDQFIVYKDNNTIRVFRQTNKDLYASQVVHKKGEPMLVSTVDENAKSYTKRELKSANKSR